MSPETPVDNREQVKFWNGNAGEGWVAQQEAMDRNVRRHGELAMEAAGIQLGERGLDIGCGCADTTLALAERVGNGGTIVGIDISKQMLARGQERVKRRIAAVGAGAAAPLAPISLREEDAQTAALPASDFAYSRFGVMFFSDPLIAFRNLRRAAPRLAFVTWRGLAENQWSRVPADAIASFVPPSPPIDPRAPGPFSLSDKEHLHGLLTEAGYREISIAPHDVKVSWTSSPDLAAAVAFFTGVGPAARAIVKLEPAQRKLAIAAMTEALAPHQTPSGLELGTAVWIVTAS